MIDTTYLDADTDNIRLARASILAMAQMLNDMGLSTGSSLVGHPGGTIKSFLDTGLVVECSSAAEENAAWAAGAVVVIRTDLLALESQVVHLAMEGANGAGVFNDLSAKPKRVTRVGTPTTVTSTSKFGASSMDYSGAGNYLSIIDNSDLRLTETWTMECWHKFKTNHIGTKHCFIASKGNTGDLVNAWYLGILIGGNIVFSSYNNASTISVAYPHTTDTTNWHHISVNCINNSVKIYVDGVSIGTGTVTTLAQSSGSLIVGGWNYTTANTEGDYIDDFVITNGVALRSANFTPPAAPIGIPATAVVDNSYLYADSMDLGTWTPAFSCATTGDLATASVSATGKWFRFGKQVTLTFSYSATITHSTASGIVKLTGVPIGLIAPGAQFSAMGSYQGFTSAGFTTLGSQMAGTAELYITKSGSAQATINCPITDFPTTGTVKLNGSITYLMP